MIGIHNIGILADSVYQIPNAGPVPGSQKGLGDEYSPL